MGCQGRRDTWSVQHIQIPTKYKITNQSLDNTWLVVENIYLFIYVLLLLCIIIII
jgi:hypothetical protein